MKGINIEMHNIEVEDYFCLFQYNWGLTVLNHVMHLILLKEQKD